MSSRTAKFIAKRIALGILTLFAVSVVVFAATQALPGNAAQAILGKTATPAALAALTRAAAPQRVGVQRSTCTGSAESSPATSARRPRPRSRSRTLLSKRLGQLRRSSCSSRRVVAIPLSIGLGVLMAMKRDKTGRPRAARRASLVVAALPEFVIGIVLVLMFATSVFHVFPAVSLLATGPARLEQPEAWWSCRRRRWSSR